MVPFLLVHWLIHTIFSIMIKNRLLCMDRRSHLLGGIGLSLLPHLVMAENGEKTVRGRFEVLTASLHVANIDLIQSYEPFGLSEISIKVKNRGIASLFGGRHRVTMTTRFQTNSETRPTSFVSFVEKPDRKRKVTVTYNGSGFVDDVEINNDGRRRKSKVPRQLWTNAIDPLTALVQLQNLQDKVGLEGPLIYPLFDGRKRADLNVHRAAGGRDLKISLLARYGFEPGEDDFVSWDGEPAKILDLVFDGQKPPLPKNLSSQEGSWNSELILVERT